MTKTICDICGKTPASAVKILIDGSPALQLDMCADDSANLIKSATEKITVQDVQAIVK